MRRAECVRGAIAVGVVGLVSCATPPVDPPEIVRAPVEVPSSPDEPSPVQPLPPSSDAGAVELSVEEAAVLALSNNRDLRVQQLAPVIAGTFEQIERGVFDPEVFAEGQFFQENATQTARATGEQFDVEGRNSDARVGVRQRLPTGTDIEAAVGHQYDVSDRTPEQHEARLDLTVTQRLLRGFGPTVNLAAVHQAELEAEVSRSELQAFVQSLLARTEIAYWSFVLAEQEIAIFERSLEVARREREEIEERIEVGVLPELEAAPARAQVARRKQALIDAESRLEAARLRLAQLVTPAPTGGLDVHFVATSDPKIEPTHLGDPRDRLALAERHRPELTEAELRLRQGRLDTVVTRNGLLPQLDFFVAFGKTGFASSFPASFGGIDEPTYDVRAGLSLSQFVSSRAARAADLGARATERQRRAAIDNLRQLVRLDVRLALNEVQRAEAQISASATTRALEVEAVAAEKQRFEVGASTALLVAQAQRDLLVSQIEEVRAVVDYRLALVRLYEAEGTLLARRGLRVADAGE